MNLPKEVKYGGFALRATPLDDGWTRLELGHVQGETITWQQDAVEIEAKLAPHMSLPLGVSEWLVGFQPIGLDLTRALFLWSELVDYE